MTGRLAALNGAYTFKNRQSSELGLGLNKNRCHLKIVSRKNVHDNGSIGKALLALNQMWVPLKVQFYQEGPGEHC